MPDKYIPELNGYYLDIYDIQDRYENSVISHEYPFTNRNLLENIGQKTRKIHVDCSFQENPATTAGWSAGTSIIPTYQAHYGFLDMIKSNHGIVTLTHPKYGEIEGMINNVTVFADDTDEYARVGFDFLEQVSSEEITFVEHIVAKLATGFRETSEKMDSELEKVKNAALNVNTWTGLMNTYIGKLNAIYNTVTSPATSIINTINYATDMPGQILEGINGAIDRMIQAIVDIRNAPASFVNSAIVGVRQTKAIFTGAEADYVHVMGASRVAYETGVVLNEESERRNEVEKKFAIPIKEWMKKTNKRIVEYA